MKTAKPIFIVLFLLLTAQIASAYYCPSTGRWLSRDPLGEPGFELLRATSTVTRVGQPINHASLSTKSWINRDPIAAKKQPNRYGFVANSPTGLIDYLGLDNPGCDLPKWAVPSWNQDCFLRCCALHDMCFYQERDFGGKPCTKKSWSQLLNPCSRCGKCNRDVVGCFLGCLSGADTASGPMWFCSKGPSAGTMYYDWDAIPASCWEDGQKPENP